MKYHYKENMNRQKWKVEKRKERVLKEFPSFLVTLFLLFVIFVGVFFTAVKNGLDVVDVDIFSFNKNELKEEIVDVEVKNLYNQEFFIEILESDS